MDLKNKLIQTGLPSREAEVYLALLQKSEFTASEVTKITKVTRSKIYEILQNLIHKGVCNENYKNGQKIYRAIDPKLAIQNIISSYENEIEQKKKNEIEKMKQAGSSIEEELISLYKNSIDNNDSIDYIEVLTDKIQIKDRYESIEKKTKKELLGFTIPPYIISDNLADNIERQNEIMKKKIIKMKCLYEFSNNTPQELENLIKTIELYQNAGEEARIVKKLPMKLVVSDGMTTMLALKDRVSLKPSMTTVIIEHPSFAEALKEVFECYWAKGISIKEFKRNKTKYLNNN
jgi:HTH-type transcriptional regulator, sugar sensing transcriptional regulator